MAWGSPVNGRIYQEGLFPAVGGPRNILPSNYFLLVPLSYPIALGWNAVEAALTQNATNEYTGGGPQGLRSYFYDTVGVQVGRDPTLSGVPAMTQVYKVVWNWIEGSGATWSESYWVNASTAQQAATPPLGVLTTRLGIADPTSLLKSIRSFSTLSSRDTFINTLLISGKYSSPTGAGPAPAGTSAVVSFGRPVPGRFFTGGEDSIHPLSSSIRSQAFPCPPPSCSVRLRLSQLITGPRGPGSVYSTRPCDTRLSTWFIIPLRS